MTNNPVATNLSIVTPYVSVTTDTVSFQTVGQDETIYTAPAGTIAALTVVFPPDDSSRIGQIIRLVSTQTVTALTVTSTNLTLKGTAVTALVANTPVVFQKVLASTWLRLS